eukprot:CAMPEP_0172298254 /NCGR_PEP_ID=MMETSP1058-20130122/991_1 /TAXON_ID=83371 /ORGANISM="Detonula confervacea, Strain CCMP 353" /LENGTH=518 /DNA_ID=CAMNT_0013007515 /DNA_START=28 /DNA_END=1584 /DNA_ORIENTATION=+
MRLSTATATALSLAAIASPQAALAFSPGGVRLLAHDSASAAGSLSISHRRHHQPTARRIVVPSSLSSVTRLYATDNDADDEGDDDDINTPSENAYADPNYPDLEFVNYDDPNYSADKGMGNSEIFQEEDQTLAEIEAMREDRRRRNDEFQFETYHANVLRGGERSLGEWTVFQTDTFMGDEAVKGRHPEAMGVPRLLKWEKVLKVVSRGSKVVTDPNAEWRVDGEHLVHEERLATLDDFPTLMMSEETEDEDNVEGLNWESKDIGHVENTFWPNEMASLDFRGPGGNMCVGKAYSICDATPLKDDTDELHDGPFSEMRTELGVQENGMRFRVKLDYAMLEEDAANAIPPPLHLRTLTICRETLDGYWPNPLDNEKPKEGDDDDVSKEVKSEVRRRNQEEITTALFGPPGAPNGLYDPPPVGGEERAVENYMQLDFEGGATVLLPHRLDQDGGDGESGEEPFGWVTSLDWTPGPIRYQVDRKVLSGTKLKGLRTLELSEVQGEEADQWRPKDGGENMRQ